jgi:tRNA(Ile)-lysidine synthase
MSRHVRTPAGSTLDPASGAAGPGDRCAGRRLQRRLATEPGLRARGLRAVHVDHGLQPAAGDWTAHCARQAAAWDVPLQVLRIDVPRDTGAGLEAAAREARYAAISATLAAGDLLATAHHRDDQAETFLLRALRASGPEGLAAMRPLRRLGHAWHWRPLLDAPREDLLAYARAHGLTWVEDPSNALPDPDRNFLRLQVLPLLARRWPHAAASLARSADLCGQADELLAVEDARSLAALVAADPHTLQVTALQALPAQRRARVLRLWIRQLGLPRLPARGVERIDRELLAARADAQARFEWSGACVLRWRGLLHADLHREPLPAAWRTTWDGRAPLALPGGGLLRLRSAGGHDNAAGSAGAGSGSELGAPAGTGFDAPLQVHARNGGERIVLPGRTHSHALKHVLQDRALPPWRRSQLPLLSDAAGQLLAAADVACAAPLSQWLQARRLELAWRPPGGAGMPAR